MENIEIKYSKVKNNIDYSESNSENKTCKLAKLLLSIDNIYEIAQ